MNGPKSVKYRKVHGPQCKFEREEIKYLNPVFGIYSLKFAKSGIITATELDAARKTLKKLLKKRGVIWTAVFPNESVSSKPTEVRMGKGKGMHDYWVARVNSGRVLFEISGVSKKVVDEIFFIVKRKISLPTEVVKLKQ
jgi:large subunit ribosomal protein L16